MVKAERYYSVRPSWVKALRARDFEDVVGKDTAAKMISEWGAANYRIDRSQEEYLHGLPTFEGRNFLGHIAASVDDGNSVSVLDVGCGNGQFLSELLLSFPDIKAVGLSATDLRDKSENPIHSAKIERVDYRVGDAQSLKKLIPDSDFDFIFSMWALPHTGDPLNVLKQMYQMLKPDGIAFVYAMGVNLTMQEAEALKDCWKDAGIKSEFRRGFVDSVQASPYHVSIQRSDTAKLPMPFSYTLKGSGHLNYKMNI